MTLLIIDSRFLLSQPEKKNIFIGEPSDYS